MGEYEFVNLTQCDFEAQRTAFSPAARYLYGRCLGIHGQRQTVPRKLGTKTPVEKVNITDNPYDQYGRSANR